MTAITVGQLPEQTGHAGPRSILYCEHCGAEYSANRGDYFLVPDDYVFKCCDQDMRLVTKHTVYRDVTL